MALTPAFPSCSWRCQARCFLAVADLRPRPRPRSRFETAALCSLGLIASSASARSRVPRRAARILLLGGAGRIGTAAAVHLLKRAKEPIEVVLAGRSAAKGAAAVAEVEAEVDASSRHELSFCQVDWQERGALETLLAEQSPTALLHTAGPFDAEPRVLEAALEHKVPVYVDVADPMSYLDKAIAMDAVAKQANTSAVVSAGAFPGFSNILAMECVAQLRGGDAACELRDMNFAYFTAGLGGSGAVNLLITNLGFGDPVPVFRGGAYAPQRVAGAEPRRVEFFLDEADPAFEFVGERDVWSWPFPEAGTVPRLVGITGDSSTGMGTAPGIWNTILVGLVSLVPRDLWQERWFSEGLAWFSLPMVWFTDQFVKETHAMRVEVTTSDGRRCVAVQTHESFRRCVAQSSAEFLLHLLERQTSTGASGLSWRPGVFLPEQLAEDEATRSDLFQRLSQTEGTVSCGVRVSS